MIQDSDISFVVQGPYIDSSTDERLSTFQCITSIRQYFPKSIIIFSQSGNDIISPDIELLLDHHIQCSDAGRLCYGKVKGEDIYTNLNR